MTSGAINDPYRPSLEGGGARHYRIVFNFGGNAQGYYGVNPAAGVIDVNGVLFGTTEYGGAYGLRGSTLSGTVFSITTSGQEAIVHSFLGAQVDGADPVGAVISVDGILYGTTNAGGKYGGGTVFSMSTSGKDERVLHNFGYGMDGYKPRANVTFVDGTLYGTTYEGGTSGKGTVFSVRARDGKERILHSFSGNPDGEYPVAGLTDVNGSLYGTTEDGGAQGEGTVFSVSTSGTESVLYNFAGAAGAYPYAGLIAVNGWLYGTTGGGGAAGYGTVFRINKTGTNERVLYSFRNDGFDGIAPVAGLVAVNGAFYGTTSEGGAAGVGTVFRVGAKGNKLVLHSFGEYYQGDGSTPQGALHYVSGTLYGTTRWGGESAPSCDYRDACAWGTVFALSP